MRGLSEQRTHRFHYPIENADLHQSYAIHFLTFTKESGVSASPHRGRGYPLPIPETGRAFFNCAGRLRPLVVRILVIHWRGKRECDVTMAYSLHIECNLRDKIGR